MYCLIMDLFTRTKHKKNLHGHFVVQIIWKATYIESGPHYSYLISSELYFD